MPVSSCSPTWTDTASPTLPSQAFQAGTAPPRHRQGHHAALWRRARGADREGRARGPNLAPPAERPPAPRNGPGTAPARPAPAPAAPPPISVIKCTGKLPREKRLSHGTHELGEISFPWRWDRMHQLGARPCRVNVTLGHNSYCNRHRVFCSLRRDNRKSAAKIEMKTTCKYVSA